MADYHYVIPIPPDIAQQKKRKWMEVKSLAGHNHHHVGMMGRKMKRQRRPDTVQVAGSRLPDCSHACGSCSPCRLVMVSFVCASLEEAETCPMAYKCMCKNKSYPVP
ncbi:hypothetical protein Bca4012_096356 [Brassica carinata]